MFNIVFYEPRIPGNTGSSIRLAAATGCTLHLIEPLGFELSGTKLRRAGLDYHDLANVIVHPSWDAFTAHPSVTGSRLFAFTGRATTTHSEISYAPGDALLFGPEPDGLPEHILSDPHVSEQVRIPMLPGIRSLNLANAASIATYEAWRQQRYAHPPGSGE